MASEPDPETARPRPRFSLERATDLWQAAFDAASSALRAAEGCFPAPELAARRQRLVVEEAATVKLLGDLARLEHLYPAPHLFLAAVSLRQLGLPDGIEACIFDLDGVLADSAAVHRSAWAQTFNEFLLLRSALTRREVTLFDPQGDYLNYIDGRPRLEGVREFLASRGISLPTGQPDDTPELDTVYALANVKNAALQTHLARQGLSAFAGSHHYLELARHAGLRRAVVSASANTEAMLELTGLSSLVEARIDGETIRREQLRVRPAPDTLLAACHALDVLPERTAVFEHNLAGIEAGVRGGFAFVVGVDSSGQEQAMIAQGADRVVRDLSALLSSGLLL